jgi:hypothetical protein
MNFSEVFPALTIAKSERDYSQLDLTSKSQLLRDKIKLLRQATKAPPEIIHQIETHLNAISQEQNLLGRWGHYALAYEGYIAAASGDDLLGVMLTLRSCSRVLDQPSQEIWSREKLEQLEGDVRQGIITPALREEIASLARAIYDSGFRNTRDTELRSKLVRMALSLNVFFCVLVIVLLLIFQIKYLAADSPWHSLLIGCLGASGGLLSATIRLRRLQLNREDLQNGQAVLLFRAAFGAIAAIIATLFVQLRVIDFPFLHPDGAATTPVAPMALYVLGFATGCGEAILFRALEKVSTRDRRETDRYQAQVEQREPLDSQ